MKKLLTVFVLTWTVLCLIVTGETVLSQDWWAVFRQSSNTPQASANIFVQGARTARSQGYAQAGDTRYYAEKDGLRGLALTYWLYPLNAQQLGDIEQIFTRPVYDQQYFIGSIDLFHTYQSQVPTDYQAKILVQDDDNVFVVVEKR